MENPFDIQEQLADLEQLEKQKDRKPVDENPFLLQPMTESNRTKSRKQKSQKRRDKAVWREYVETIVVALVVAIILRMFVVSAYRVSSGSMEDTLLPGDYIFVNKLAYEFGDPEVGEIVVFENPVDASKDYIKRIIATEGQTVEIIDKVLYVDGKVAEVPEYLKHVDNRIFPEVLSVRDNFGPMQVPKGQYFLMGDNRDDSQDSRFWGCIDETYFKGRALFVYFSYEPDPNSPEWKAPYILEFFEIIGYNIGCFHERLRLGRVGNGL